MVDVSQGNRGYDILCRKPDGVLRVEVKGLKGYVISFDDPE